MSFTLFLEKLSKLDELIVPLYFLLYTSNNWIDYEIEFVGAQLGQNGWMYSIDY